MTDALKKFAENLKRIRKNRGMSRAQIANIIGIDENSVGAYERGGREPSLSRIIQLTEILGVSVEELVEDSPNALEKSVMKYRLQRALKTVETTKLLHIDLEKSGDKIKISKLIYPQFTGTPLENIKDIKVEFLSINFQENQEFVEKIEEIEQYALANNLTFISSFQKIFEVKIYNYDIS